MNQKHDAPTGQQSLDPMMGKAFFADPATDRLLGVTLSLAGELWVAVERITALEAIVHPSARDAQRDNSKERDAFIRHVFAAIREPLDSKAPE